MSRARLWLVPVVVVLTALIGVGMWGYFIGRSFGEPNRAPYSAPLGDSGPGIFPAAPIDTAPPFVQKVLAVGCAQKVSVTVPAGEGLLVVNTGKVALKLASGGMISIPAWPLATGAWIHFKMGQAGSYRVTGTRSSCTTSGLPAPHFDLNVTVP